MATLRKITLNWEIRTGAITCDTGYIKRQELCDVDLYVTVDGTPYALDTSWALNLSIKPALLGDNAALVAVTTWTASATTGLYQATAQTIGGTALDTYIAANNADTTDDEGNKLVDLDVYYTVSMAMKAKSDTVTVICKPDVGRADDTVPATIIARNDFLVTNGTGLLVNVAAGYAANGAFVAAQASLAITNATNYIEVTAAGVASVNTTAFSAGSYPLATVVASAGAITANTDLRAWITPKPAAAGGVTSITGTANEITVTGTTTPTLSLPSALTFTSKTVTGGTFNSGAFNGTIGATTPSTVAGTTGTFNSTVTVGANGNAGTLNVKNSGGTTTASINGVAGTASFLNGAVVLTDSPSSQINASDVSLYIDTVLADNGLWIYDGVNALAGLDYDGTAQFKTGAITLGKNTGTAAYIDENGKAWFGGGQTVVEAGAVSSYQFTAEDNVTIGSNSTAGTLNVKDSGGTTTASISGADGSASFANGDLTIGADGSVAVGANLVEIDGTTGDVSIANGGLTIVNGTIVSNQPASFTEITAGGGYWGYNGSLTIKNSSDTTTASIDGSDGSASFASGTFTATTSLLLGTAGSAVGNVGFKNATSGTTTLAPATGALGTGTVTLPLTGTLATLEGSNTYTGTTNTFTLPTTTGTTTTSGIAVAANSLTTGTGIYAASSSLTTGKLLNLQVSGTAAAASQTALNIATAGANGTSGITSKGAVIANTHTGTTSTNVALELTASGGTTNTALNITAGTFMAQGGMDMTGLCNFRSNISGVIGSAASFNFFSDVSNNTSYFQTNADSTHSWTLINRAAASGRVLLSVQGAASQSADLQQWQNSSATVLAKVDSAGNLSTTATLAVTGASTLTGLLTANGGITLGDAQNIAFNTTTGTKIGAATTQKLSFWNATPIVQPTTAVSSATVVSPGGGTNLKTDDTFDGYTIAQVVKALRNAGLLA